MYTSYSGRFMDENCSTQFYAALATARFGEPVPGQQDFTLSQWMLLAMWARAGYGAGMLPPREALPLAHLRPWAESLLIFDQVGVGWHQHTNGRMVSDLLRTGDVEEGWLALPVAIHGMACWAASEARPVLQRFPRWPRLRSADLNALVLPMGESAVVDRLLIMAAAVPRSLSAFRA